LLARISDELETLNTSMAARADLFDTICDVAETAIEARPSVSRVQAIPGFMLTQIYTDREAGTAPSTNALLAAGVLSNRADLDELRGVGTQLAEVVKLLQEQVRQGQSAAELLQEQVWQGQTASSAGPLRSRLSAS
jgi:hypothetical protein